MKLPQTFWIIEISYLKVLLSSYEFGKPTLDQLCMGGESFLKDPISVPPQGLCENCSFWHTFTPLFLYIPTLPQKSCFSSFFREVFSESSHPSHLLSTEAVGLSGEHSYFTLWLIVFLPSICHYSYYLCANLFNVFFPHYYKLPVSRNFAVLVIIMFPAPALCLAPRRYSESGRWVDERMGGKADSGIIGHVVDPWLPASLVS